MPSYTDLHPLFIKPLYYPGTILYNCYVESLGRTLSFRSLDLDKDIELIHKWVNMPYALPFWQFAYPKEKVFAVYYNILRSSDAHSFIGLLDGEIICQIDIYRISADEISAFVPAKEDDCGFHLLMAPNEKPIRGLSSIIVQVFLQFYFSFIESECMYAEPDIINERSNRLLQKLGFSFIKTIPMSYKQAHLYCLSKEQFLSQIPLMNAT